MKHYNVIIIGAGAAGLMCAWQAARRGLKVAVIEHMSKIAEKIRISGGGRCNFTNLYSRPDNFTSENPHFCKSALARFSPYDFMALLDERGIAYHEKPHEVLDGNENARGQMFCDESADDIIDMLKNGCMESGAAFHLSTKVKDVQREESGYVLQTDQGAFKCEKLVVASGGLSIPKIGASNFGYELAKKFGHDIVPPCPALVPLTFDKDLLAKTKALSGAAIDASVYNERASFREGLLFTHRGLSGPSILQISSYWKEGEAITVNALPARDALEFLKQARDKNARQQLKNALQEVMPARISEFLCDLTPYSDTRMADLSNSKLEEIAEILNGWQVTPSGSEGYRTAEVTRGGVDTRQVSSKSFESLKSQGLYFIGEVLDVTGHLGGHNFQWAWASGWCAGHSV